MKDIENMIENLVERVLSEEVNKKVKDITESVSTEIDEMEEYYEVAKNRKEERKATKKDEPRLIFFSWWRYRDSNPGPLPCQGSALIN